MFNPTPTKQNFKAEKISSQPFSQPGYLMKRALNFTALKAVHPQIYAALMTNAIFKLHPDVKSANFRTLDHMFSDYTDEYELSEYAPQVGEDSELPDLYRRICRLNNKAVQFPGSITPFLAYRRMDMRDFCDTICVTPDELLIFSHSPHTMEYIPLEDIQSVAVQNDAIIVNGVTYRLKCSFAPLQEKYDSLVFFIGMALAMKYPAPMPADDRPVVFEPHVTHPAPAAPKAEPKPQPVKAAPKAVDNADAVLEKISKAKQMLDDGVITAEEFSAIKARLIKEL